MKGLITSHLRRQGRAWGALLLAMAALVWLLVMWSGLPAAQARGPAVAGSNNPSLISPSSLITIYLPIIFKSDLVFFDDFSSTSSGWATGTSGKYSDDNGSCEFGYNNGRYRVKITSVASGRAMRCIIHNGRVPKQINGKFKLKVQRTSSENPFMLYGFLFGAGSDAFKNRWALEVSPNKETDSKKTCYNKPYYWLSATVNGDGKYFKTECTNEIKTGKDENTLMVIRNGSTITVYINGEPIKTYTDASYLLNEGYFSLEVLSAGVVTVEFDDVEIRSSTTP